MGFLLHILLTSLLLMVVAKFVTGFEVDSWGAAIVGALVLGFVNAVVKPIAVFLSLPVTILTLGLFLIVVNAAMLWIMAAVVPGVRLRTFGAALWAGLLLSILSSILYRIL
ncbi:MAG: phage holin family protein [Gemmatimonadota bacterium]